MIQVSPGNFIPVSNFAGTSTSFAPRGGLGAQGAGFGSLTVGGLGAGSSGMTGGGGSYVSPGQATVPTEKEQYNIRKGAVKKALNNLSNAIADARAFDKGASGLTTEQKQQAVTDARKEVETLGITRDEIESFNKDQGREVISPRVVEGNLLDKAGDFTQDAGQELIDLIATGGQKFSDIITLGQGPEVAQTLLNPISILTGGLGGTINYGESGSTTPLILGTQPGTGQQVGLSIPDPRYIFEGGLPGLLGGLGTLGTMAGAASFTDDKADPASGVGTSAASVLAAANAGDDKDKTTTTTPPAGGATSADTVKAVDIAGDMTSKGDAVKTGALGVDIGSDLSEKDKIKTGSIALNTGDLSSEDLEVADIIRTNAGTDVGLISPVKTSEPVKTSTAGGGAASGGSGMPAGGGGTGTISGGPGPLVDIDYLYDMAGSLAQPFLSTEDEDEEDLKVYAKGGGHVKRFNTGTQVSAYPPQSLIPEEDGGTMKTGGKFSFRDFIDQNAKTIAGGLVGGLLGLSDDSGGSGPVGYQGGIPDYRFNRTLKDDAFSNVLDAQGNRINPLAATETSTMRRPGSMGRSYFDYGDELFTGTGTMQGVGLPSLVETDTTATTTTGLPPGFTYTPVSDVDTTEGAFGGAGAVDTGIGAVTPVAGAAVAGTGADVTTQVEPTDLQKFNTFLTPFYGKTLTNDDLLNLGGQEVYNVNQIGTALGIDPDVLAKAIANAQNLSAALNATTDDAAATTDDNAVDALTQFASKFANKNLTDADLLEIAGSDFSTTELAGKFPTLSADNLQAAITGAQNRETVANTFSSVDATDGIQDTERNDLVDLIKDKKATIGDVATNFNVDVVDVVADLVNNGDMTLEEVTKQVSTIQSPTDLAVQLLLQDKTTPALLAAQNEDYTEKEIADAYNFITNSNKYAQGGSLNNYYLGGPTDGMADLIPASIDGTQPAALSDGEFVIPADVVSHLGNGNSDAGANQLMSMMDRVRNARTGTTKQGTEIDPMKMMPA